MKILSLWVFGFSTGFFYTKKKCTLTGNESEKINFQEKHLLKHPQTEVVSGAIENHTLIKTPLLGIIRLWGGALSPA